MPEIRFQIEWPDGTQELCYSPSLIVKQYFSPDQSYGLDAFVQQATKALQIASDRVQARYGMPCSLALGQLQRIQAKAQTFEASPNAQVKFLRFVESTG